MDLEQVKEEVREGGDRQGAHVPRRPSPRRATRRRLHRRGDGLQRGGDQGPRLRARVLLDPATGDVSTRGTLFWRPYRSDVSLALLAGGRSTRMGEDKAFAPFQGKTLLEWMRDKLCSALSPCVRGDAGSLPVPRPGSAGGERRTPRGGVGGRCLHGRPRLSHRAGDLRGLRHALRHLAPALGAGRPIGGLRRLRPPARRVYAAALRRLQQADPGCLPGVHRGGGPAHLRHLPGPAHRLSWTWTTAATATLISCS